MEHTDKKLENCSFMALSYDLILEILFRLPLKSLGICALLSKSFNSLISDPKFAIAHLEFSNRTKPPLTLISQDDDRLSTLAFEYKNDIIQVVRLIGVDHQFPTNNYYQYHMIGSSHGLVCIYGTYNLKFDVHLMFLWNPVTAKDQDIVLPKRPGGVVLRKDACWFGYLSSINEYKIFLSYSLDEPSPGCRFYLYSFRTCLWKEVCVTDEVSRCFAQGLDVIFKIEALHCLCDRLWICKFDLVEETFGKMPFSIGEPHFLNSWEDILLGVIGKSDCLCVVLMKYYSEEEEGEEEEEDYEEEDDLTLELEVWILQEYDNLNSWKKWCRTDFGDVFSRDWMEFLGFTHNGFLCFQEDVELIIIDPINDVALNTIDYDDGCGQVCNYVESLISPVDLH